MKPRAFREVLRVGAIWGVLLAAGVSNCDADEFVYVTNYGANTVSAYRLDAQTGALQAVAGSPFTAGVGPMAACVAPEWARPSRAGMPWIALNAAPDRS